MRKSILDQQNSLENISASSDGYLNLGSLFDGASVGIFVVDDNENIIHSNKHFLNSKFKNKKIFNHPIKLSSMSNYSRKNMNGKVHFSSNGKTTECFAN